MLKRLTFLTLILALPNSALAYEVFTEYRIHSSEVLAAELGEIEHEDPASLILTLKNDSGSPEKVVIESDDLLDQCLQEIQYMEGNNSAYVQIVVNTNAQTMNGVMVIQCSAHYGLIPYSD